jgi:hypothetical protein
VPLFEAQETLDVVLTLLMKALLAKFKFTNKIIAYVKNEGRNLNTLVVTLTLVVNYVPLTSLTLPSMNMFWPCYVQGMLVCH